MMTFSVGQRVRVKKGTCNGQYGFVTFATGTYCFVSIADGPETIYAIGELEAVEK